MDTAKKFIMNNTRISNVLRKDCRFPIYANQENKLRGSRCVVNVGRDINPKTQFVIQPGNDEPDLTYFDMIIADAIYTLYKHGAKSFSPNQLLQEITGEANLLMANDRKKLFINIIDKLCNTTIDIYCPAEALKDSTIKPRYRGNFLSAAKVVTSGTAKNKGTKYKFTNKQGQSPMPLYEYGEAKKQMISVPYSLLRVPFARKKTEYIILTHYLLHELEIIRNPNNDRNERIFYPYDETNDTSYQIFGILGINPSKLTKKQKLEKAEEIFKLMESILKNWQRTDSEIEETSKMYAPYLKFEDSILMHGNDKEKTDEGSLFIKVTREDFVNLPPKEKETDSPEDKENTKSKKRIKQTKG